MDHRRHRATVAFVPPHSSLFASVSASMQMLHPRSASGMGMRDSRVSHVIPLAMGMEIKICISGTRTGAGIVTREWKEMGINKCGKFTAT